MSEQNEKHWLIRKNAAPRAASAETRAPSQISVLGPFLTDQVKRMIEQGMLDPDDEIGPQNSFWFFLHEVEEVKRQLGIEGVVLLRDSDLEPTDPQFEKTEPILALADEATPPSFEIERPTVPGMDPNATGVVKIKRNIPADSGQATARSKVASAAELSTRFQRVGQTSSQAAASSRPTSSSAAGRDPGAGLERAQLLKFVVVAGLVLAAIGVIWVIRSLRI